MKDWGHGTKDGNGDGWNQSCDGNIGCDFNYFHIIFQNKDFWYTQAKIYHARL